MKELKFVDVGEGITEGTVQKWLVKDGEKVKEDQSIVQVETDKAVVNVPSPVSGIVRFNIKEGSTIKVGDTIAYIGEESELSSITIGSISSEAQVEKQPEPQKEPVKKAEIKSESHEIIAAPSVRKMARDMKIDISNVHGTGPGGRILENDLKSFAGASQQPRMVPKFSEVLEESHKDNIERVQMSSTRKAIAKNMELSWTIPRAVHMDLINANHIYAIVHDHKEAAAKMDVKLTFLPFIIKAAIEALKENPGFNSSYDHDSQEIIYKKYYNIGIAAEAPDGLKVAVIKDADKKSIMQIAKEIQKLSQKVKDKSISIEEMRDSTFTITNIGSLGGGFLSVPMINYPEVAILGIHLIREMPVVEKGDIKVGKVLPFSLTFDHRVVDGAEAVLFGNAIIKYLEDPEFLQMLG